MHESGVVRELVARLQEVGSNAGAVRIHAVSVWLGALSQFSATHFKEHFDEEAVGTLVAGAELQITISDDVGNPNAHHVVLLGVDLDVPEGEA